MTIHETHFLPDGDIDFVTMHCVDQEIIAAGTKPESMPLLATSTSLPAIVRIETQSTDPHSPIKIDSLTATGLDTVLHQIEIFGPDAITGKPSLMIILDQTLTGDEIDSVRIGDRGFIYSKD